MKYSPSEVPFNAVCNKRPYMLKQTCKSQLEVSLSMYDLLLTPGIKGLKVALEIFKEQSHKTRSVLPAVFFEKVVLNIFRKILDDPLQSLYSAYFTFSTFKLANKLNTIFPQISTAPNTFKN